MKLHLCLLAVVFVLSSSLVTVAADALLSVDVKTRVLNTDAGGALKAYRIADPVDVRVDGVTGELRQLQPGMQLQLGFVNPQTVNRIYATSAASETLGTATAARRLHIKMKVDGTDLIAVRDGKVSIQHKAWSKPTEISVNGRSWKPKWTGDKSDEFIVTSAALQPFAPLVQVKKLKGRGSATLKQAPNTANQQTLIVEVNDGTESGAAEYDVVITW
jgi:hypothetical protein